MIIWWSLHLYWTSFFNRSNPLFNGDNSEILMRILHFFLDRNINTIVGKLNRGVCLFKFMSGAFDNHVTVGHVAFREASSIIFWLQSRRGPLSFSVFFFVSHVHANYPMRMVYQSVMDIYIISFIPIQIICTYLFGVTFFFLYLIFTQPLRSSRIWHKVNFKAEFNRFEFRVFPSLRLVASPRLKNLICPTIYP